MASPRPFRVVSPSPLRIAQLAGIAFRVPPRASGGTELVIDRLTRGLVERGHRVIRRAPALKRGTTSSRAGVETRHDLIARRR